MHPPIHHLGIMRARFCHHDTVRIAMDDCSRVCLHA